MFIVDARREFPDGLQRCLDAGMNAHLTKPLEIEKLRKALEQMEDRKTQ